MNKINKLIILIFLFFINLQVLNPKIHNNLYIVNFKNKIKVTKLKNNIINKLGNEVDNYIKTIAPTSKLNGEYLVAKCLDYNVNISFVLAQALLESHFGTKGKARYTNSVWNVGTYDNGEIIYSYKHPNQSIEPYLKLITTKYLIKINKGDTIHISIETLINNGYINYKGYRFASEKNYEKRLKKILNKIKFETKINILQKYLNHSEIKLLTSIK
jgi:flagellum-specific peptidoglycan hydrolase FlgJ